MANSRASVLSPISRTANLSLHSKVTLGFPYSFCAAFAEPDSEGCNGSDKLKGQTPGIMGWNSRLNGVADNFQLLNDIQRAWSYLESLFIHSEEVKKELPEATKRFERIDIAVKVRFSIFSTVE